ncbi:hypothetical protein SNE40_011885 [Patella caerulea]|uniref:Metalloprotease TIKI homolog n=1 Tax=Patella caerulea TaxID=87958 RepID=A0AAN8JQA4_PATCE
MGTCPPNSNQSELNSFLWIVKRDPPSYFFGTIHVPYTRVWDFVPENTKKAFNQAENIFLELDLTDPYTISALSRCQLLPHGENLSNVLPVDIYNRLKRHLDYVRDALPEWMTADQKGRGLYPDYLFNAIAGNWERKRPVWVMLMVNSLTEGDIKSRGIPVLDLYLAQMSERQGKVTGAVERVEEQCVPLNELNFSQVVFALNQTLWQHEFYRQGKETMPYTTDDLITHYNCGDLNSIIFNHDTAQVPNLVNTSLPPQDLRTAKTIDEYFRNELIDKRNQRMTERVIHLLEKYPDKSFFFAFGAGHYLGNNTVVDRMRSAGYDVQHTGPDYHIPDIVNPNPQKSPRIRKNYFSDMNSDFPLPSDVIYGDARYLFNKQYSSDLTVKERKRLLRAKKRQQQLTQLWNSLDTNSQNNQPKKKRKKKNRNHKTFNDLWVRMDAEGANFLKVLPEENPHQLQATTIPDIKYSYYHSHSTNHSPSMLVIYVAMILLLCTRNSND